ncbi:MAG: hypothetical protein Q9178_000189 [Gyalolechia marmorata]
MPARRNTAQPNAPPRPSNTSPRRSTRVTRSQSRDISDNDVEQVGGNRVREKAKRPNVISNEGTTVPSRQTKHRSKASGSVIHLHDLTKIDESPKIQYPELPQTQDRNNEEVGANRNPDTFRRQSGQTVKSTGRMSGFSGTTVRTSRSDQELSREIAEDMICNLKDLSDASDKILGKLIPRNISEASVQDKLANLLDPTSRDRKQLEKYSSTFQVHSDVYGWSSLFIDVPSIVRNVFDLPEQEDLQTGPWRMDPVLYKANLTAMVRGMMAQTNDNFEKSIEALDTEFPRPFLQRFVDKTSVEDTADGSTLLEDTFDLALDIRTRSYILHAKRLVDMPKFDPDSLLQQIFYQDTKVLNGWNVTGIRSEDLVENRKLRNTFINRLDQLRQTFSSPDIDLDSLEQRLSHNRLLASLVRWSQLRLTEIALQLERVEGADGIADAMETVLKGGDQVNVDSKSNHSQVGQTAGPAGVAMPPPVYDSTSPGAIPALVTRLKEREAILSASKNQREILQQSAAAVRATPTPAASRGLLVASAPSPARGQTKNASSSHEPPPWQPPRVEDEEGLNNEPDSATTIESILQTQKKIDAESNKENVAIQTRPQPTSSSQTNPRKGTPVRKQHFIDAQPGARRIPFESQEPEPSVVKNPPLLSAQNLQGEAGGSQIDVSEDEGFQLDTRQITVSKKRNRASRDHSTRANGQTPSKRARTEGRRVPAEDGDLGNAMQRHNAAYDPPAPSQIETYRVVNSTAKFRVAMQHKRRQIRNPWSDEETNRLQELIEDFGLSWSFLRDQDNRHKDGPALMERDQVALKDKARNMKMDYLKASSYLPKNFRGIPINAAMIDKLMSMGIHYDREIGARTDGDFTDEDE